MQGNIDNEFQYSILQSSAADPSFYMSSLEHIYTNSDSWRKLKDTTKKGGWRYQYNRVEITNPVQHVVK